VPHLFTRGRPNRESFTTLLHFGKWVTVSNLVAPALLYADRFLLGSLGTLSQVAYFTAPFQVVERLLVIPGTLTSTLFPAVSALDSAQSRERIHQLSAQSLQVLLCTMGTLAILLVGLAPWLVWALFGAAYLDHSIPVFRIILLGISINALAFIPFTVVQGCGRPDITAKLHLIEFPIHLLALAAGYHLAGLPGVAWAWTLRVTLDGALLLAVCFRRRWMALDALRSQATFQTAALYLLVGTGLALVPWQNGQLQLGITAVVSVATLLYTVRWGLPEAARAQLWKVLRQRKPTPEAL
jgi:O-antigen/teichoic acid export membrane protein